MSEKNVELGIILFQFLMSFLKTKGLSEDEIDQVYEQARRGKEARPSENLPDA
jgi:hypothetical protein